jgi:hypothetical protein
MIFSVYADLYFHGSKVKPGAGKMVVKKISIGYQSDHSVGPRFAYGPAYIKNPWVQQRFTTKQHRDVGF